MVTSPLLELGEIPHPASLAILTDCGEGSGVSSCDDDRATQVDSTGPTTINMLIMINTSHLIITYYEECFKSKL